ncbi:MAG: hypothetical protein EPO26_14390 [Chloroflexota bacterium]|nr:MAG: hypothetical protein EPO26_14390 [Chloroflexota bacterium]
MGHTRLGTIPKTRKWRAVVAEVARVGEIGFGGAGGRTVDLADDVEDLSRRALDAAKNGLDRAVDDAGLRHTFFLLTQLVLAARHEDWRARLGLVGIRVPEVATVFDLVVEVQAAIDDTVAFRGRATDISEMAQQAAGEAITALAGPRALTLFGENADDVRLAVRTLSTRNGFGELGQRFFGGFMTRFLNFYLSRVTASYLGGPRVEQVGDVTRFNDALAHHCQESARIVRDFCAQWYSSTEFREGITPENTAGFMAVAIRKIQSELSRQGSGG